MNNINYIIILILAFVGVYSANAENTIPKPKLLDTLIIKDGDRDSRTINFIKWQLDSTSASTDDFLIEDVKYSFDKIYNLSFGYSKYLFKFNNTTKLYGSISYSLLSSRGDASNNGSGGGIGLPLNLNLIIGDQNCLDIGVGYTKLFINMSGINNSSADFLTFDLAYRLQYKYPRSKKPLPTGVMMKFGISSMYDLNNIQIIDKKFIISVYAGIGLPL